MLSKLREWVIVKLAGNKTVMLNADMEIDGFVNVRSNPSGSIVEGNIFRRGK